MLIVMYGGMLRKGVCMIYVVLYIYNNLGFEFSYEYLSGGPEPTNGEIIQNIKVAKLRFIGIIFP